MSRTSKIISVQGPTSPPEDIGALAAQRRPKHRVVERALIADIAPKTELRRLIREGLDDVDGAASCRWKKPRPGPIPCIRAPPPTPLSAGM